VNVPQPTSFCSKKDESGYAHEMHIRFHGDPSGILFSGYRKRHRRFLPNSLLASLAEFGGRFESPITKMKADTHLRCIPAFMVTHRGFSSPAIESATGAFSQTLCSLRSQSLEVVSNPRLQK